MSDLLASDVVRILNANKYLGYNDYRSSDIGRSIGRGDKWFDLQFTDQDNCDQIVSGGDVWLSRKKAWKLATEFLSRAKEAKPFLDIDAVVRILNENQYLGHADYVANHPLCSVGRGNDWIGLRPKGYSICDKIVSGDVVWLSSTWARFIADSYLSRATNSNRSFSYGDPYIADVLNRAKFWCQDDWVVVTNSEVGKPTFHVECGNGSKLLYEGAVQQAKRILEEEACGKLSATKTERGNSYMSGPESTSDNGSTVVSILNENRYLGFDTWMQANDGSGAFIVPPAPVLGKDYARLVAQHFLAKAQDLNRSESEPKPLTIDDAIKVLSQRKYCGYDDWQIAKGKDGSTMSFAIENGGATFLTEFETIAVAEKLLRDESK